MRWIGPALGHLLQALEHCRWCLEELTEPAHRRRARVGITALRRQKPSAPHNRRLRMQLRRRRRWWRRATEQDKEEKDQQSWEGGYSKFVGSGRRLHNGVCFVRSWREWRLEYCVLWTLLIASDLMRHLLDQAALIFSCECHMCVCALTIKYYIHANY